MKITRLSKRSLGFEMAASAGCCCCVATCCCWTVNVEQQKALDTQMIQSNQFIADRALVPQAQAKVAF